MLLQVFKGKSHSKQHREAGLMLSLHPYKFKHSVKLLLSLLPYWEYHHCALKRGSSGNKQYCMSNIVFHSTKRMILVYYKVWTRYHIHGHPVDYRKLSRVVHCTYVKRSKENVDIAASPRYSCWVCPTPNMAQIQLEFHPELWLVCASKLYYQLDFYQESGMDHQPQSPPSFRLLPPVHLIDIHFWSALLLLAQDQAIIEWIWHRLVTLMGLNLLRRMLRNTFSEEMEAN